MDSRKITAGGLIVTSIILTIYDIWAVVNEVSDDTISRVVLKAAAEHHTIPLAVGAIMGHLFWPSKKKLIPFLYDNRLLLLAIVGITSAIVDVFFYFGALGMTIAFPLGYLIGHVFWSQNLEEEGV